MGTGWLRRVGYRMIKYAWLLIDAHYFQMLYMAMISIIVLWSMGKMRHTTLRIPQKPLRSNDARHISFVTLN